MNALSYILQQYGFPPILVHKSTGGNEILRITSLGDTRVDSNGNDRKVS